MKSLLIILSFVCVLMVSCTGQAESTQNQVKRIDNVIIPLSSGTLMGEYNHLKIPWNPYYVEASNNFVYPGYAEAEEVLASWQMAKSNKYLRAHYVRPEDAPVLDWDLQKIKTNPKYINRNFLALEYCFWKGDQASDFYEVIVTSVYKDSILQDQKEVFILKKMDNGQYKIATEISDSNTLELIVINSKVSLEFFKELEKKNEEDLINQDEFFLEAYRASRSIKKNGFDFQKLKNLFKKWRSQGMKEKIDYFFREKVIYHGGKEAMDIQIY